jgi:hypothetical protein
MVAASDRRSRAARPGLTRRRFLIASAAGIAACASPGPSAGDVLVFGKQGVRDGDFLHPRAIGVHGGRVHVIDKSGRLQRFTEDGAFIDAWRIPKIDNGTPTDIGFANGLILVPDTHNNRILEYADGGERVRTWGERGEEPGAFVYPTGITTGPEGLLYVSEYGDRAERIQVFDANGNYRFHWGRAGQGPGEFNRAMAILADSRGRIVVADMGNHRVQIFNAEGTHLVSFGDAIDPPLAFPFDIALGPGESILTIDYGTHRLSRFDAEGRLLSTFGSPGRTPGQFNSPRGVAATADWIFVADTENHRVQRIPVEAMA